MICTPGQGKIPQEFMDNFAKKYREMLKPEWIGVSHGVRDWDYSMALYYAPPNPDDVVLDVGCGESGFGGYVAHSVELVWGVDDGSWAEFYAKWESTLGHFPHNFWVKKTNAAALPFPDNSFDKVFTFSAFEHFGGEDDILASREVARVLKPGGVLAGTVDFNAVTVNPIEGCDCYTLNSFYQRIVTPSGLMPVGDVSIGEMSPTAVTALFFLLRKDDEDMGQDTEG
jgi:ubiquinone/menaquinone biosynthesis C-methylase UbiE